MLGLDSNKLGKYLMELIGTGILLLTIQLSLGLEDLSQAPIAIGLMLTCIIYAGGPISGGHYNPAISLAIALRGKLDHAEMLMYWIFQIIGGFLGALLGGIIGGNLAGLSLGEGHSGLQAFLAELVLTFLLCFVCLGVATHSDASDNSYYGMAIGLVVMSGLILVGPISGGAFNPAVVLGLSLAKLDILNLMYILNIILANLLGGILAATCFHLVAPDQFLAGTSQNGHLPVGETTHLIK